MITKYYKKATKKLSNKLNILKEDKCSYIVLFKNEEPLAYLCFEVADLVIINKLNYKTEEHLSYLFSKLYFISHLSKKLKLDITEYLKNETFFKTA